MATPTGARALRIEPDPAPGTEAGPDRLRAALEASQQQLRASEAALAHLQYAFWAIADGIAVTDLLGRVTCFNPVAAHLTGWTQSESHGRPLSEVLRITNARGRQVNLIEDGFGESHHDIVSLIRRDGHVILVDGAVAEVLDDARQRVGYIVTFRNVTAATRLNRELFHQANHDALTGLHNRRVFDAQLQRAIASAGEQRCCHALLYFDLDRFKTVNDGSGHMAGDELLRQLALRLRGQLREHDTLARLGGDEFGALLENCDATRAQRVAEKIRSTVADFDFCWDGRDYRLGVSIGVVEISDGRLSTQELVAAADRMCYVAKASGRNRIAVHDALGVGDRDHDVSHRAGARRESADRLTA